MSFVIDTLPEGLEEDSCFIAVSEGKILLRAGQGESDHHALLGESDFLFTSSQLPESGDLGLYLGRYHERRVYALALDSEESDDESTEWSPLRPLLGRVDASSFALLSRALQLAKWDKDHQFCGGCGESTENLGTEHAKRCPSCELVVYPRISPCIMALVQREDQILLARGFNFPEGVYSALAGFVESGENLEQAVVREVEEETGIKVGNLRYFASQNWPFPAQLMIGFNADYVSGELKPDGIEIEDAQWFSVNELPFTPPKQSLSGQMIAAMIEQIRSESNGVKQ